MYTHNNKIITDCIDWALEHGYNPFDSTHSLPARRMKIYTAYNEVCKQSTDKLDIIRAAFERITETTYEGDFAKYPDGDYVNEIQQYQWEGFHDGWKR